MSLSNRKLAVGTGVAGIVAVIAVAIFWTDSDEEPSLLDELEVQAPIAFPDAWAELEDGQRIDFAPSPSPAWSDETGTVVLDGPTIEGLDFAWSKKHRDQWVIAYGRARDGDVDVQTHIWTSPGFPMAIIDFDAQLTGSALAEPLSATTTISGTDAEVLTGALEPMTSSQGLDDLDILAARSATNGSTIQIHAPGGASGHTTEIDSRQLAIDWALWPGIDGFDDCLDDRSARRQVSLRLVVHFGDQPMVAPLPVAAPTHSAGTPIFVDAPDTEEWTDGRARSSQDFARRLRALAFGHSDRDDPRYGNGGLLAAEMGAVFAIPAGWWDEESIIALRQSLAPTGIEVMATGDVEDQQPPSTTTQWLAPDDCDRLFSPDDTGTAELVILPRFEHSSPFRASLASPIPAVIETGISPPERDIVLDRLFDENHRDGLFVDREYRSLVFPVVATRNPLVDVNHHKILSPDRNGHWTLHDSLTRKLSRLEMIGSKRHGRTSISFEDLGTHRLQHKRAIPYWLPDGSLEYGTEAADHLYIFGDTEAIAMTTEAHRFVSWNRLELDSPAYNEPLNPITIEFEF